MKGLSPDPASGSGPGPRPGHGSGLGPDPVTQIFTMHESESGQGVSALFRKHQGRAMRRTG